jgi:SAM-dependent methyltransferase
VTLAQWWKGLFGAAPAPKAPKRGYRDPFAHGLYPLGVPTHDLGRRRLFELSSVLLMLECRPGDRVLDLGAGTGFSSEMLARFGYHVIAIDPDLQALRYNRERPSYDDSRIDGTITVIGSLAEDLPFRDATFDGIVGLNVLHHIEDLPRATREFARVLKPGARAAFCEPGLEHLETLETKRAIADFGEDDRAFDVFAFLEGARSLGFTWSFFSATLLPSLRMVPVWDIELFASGQHPTRTLTERGVVDEIHQRHAFAMMVRDGERERTSRFPGVMRREIRVEGFPKRAIRGEVYRATAFVRNVGDTRWIAEPSPMGGFVTIGCKFANESGRMVNDLMGRTFLPVDVRPNEQVIAEMSIPIPTDIPPGRYELRFDTVNEMVCWFSDLPDNPLFVVPVAIE